MLAASARSADGPVATATQTLIGLNDVAAGGFEPPDVQVAAGAGYVVEMVNLAARTWRTGAGPAQAVQTEPLAMLFGSAADDLTDPRIAYDAGSGRWFATISDLTTKSVRLAVSSGADPTGPWTVSSYAAPGCADQPRLGFTDGTIVLAADIFRDCTEEALQPIGSELWVANKQELLDGATTPDFTKIALGGDLSSVAPVQSLSSTSTEYAVSVDAPSSRVVHLFAIDGIPPAGVSVREIATPSINRVFRPPFAVQPPNAAGRPEQAIATNDDRVLDAVWENGRLWFTDNTACTPLGETLLRACSRLVELSTATGTVVSDNNLSQPGADVYFATVRPDGAGDLVIVFGESNIAIRPEVVALARTPDGTFTNSVVIAQSAGTFLGDRYGDYFGAARDPADPDVVWVAGEAGTDVAGGRGWSTTVAAVAVTAAGGTPPMVLTEPPPSFHALHVSARAGSSVKLNYRAVEDGGSVRTVATVTSKRAIVFAKTTAPMAYHAGQLYFVTWHPAKKLRGTLSFCVHAVSSTGVTAARSCSTVTLR